MKPGPEEGALVILVGAGLWLPGFSFFCLDAKRDDFGCSFLLRELLEPFLLVVLTLVTLIVSFRSEDREPRGVRATGDRVP